MDDALDIEHYKTVSLFFFFLREKITSSQSGFVTT